MPSRLLSLVLSTNMGRQAAFAIERQPEGTHASRYGLLLRCLSEVAVSQILITGAAGYIGSHMAARLVAAGRDVVGVDNWSNSHRSVPKRVEALSGQLDFVELDLRDRDGLQLLFAERDVGAVMHFAGVKSVADSVSDPVSYYDVNVGATLCLLAAMADADVHDLVFSSSCTVYGEGDGGSSAINELSPIAPTSPYGHSKRMVEQVLVHAAEANPHLRLVSLRYFNPGGAHPSGLLGEAPVRPARNLVPLLAQAAFHGRTIPVCGTDLGTPDGTCVRDYIHIEDLVSGHLAALDHLKPGHEVINLGTGTGSSVLEVVQAMERASGRSIALDPQPPRAGDAVALWANPGLAGARLGWKTELGLDDICRSQWRFQMTHPNGYA